MASGGCGAAGLTSSSPRPLPIDVASLRSSGSSGHSGSSGPMPVPAPVRSSSGNSAAAAAAGLTPETPPPAGVPADAAGSPRSTVSYSSVHSAASSPCGGAAAAAAAAASPFRPAAAGASSRFDASAFAGSPAPVAPPCTPVQSPVPPLYPPVPAPLAANHSFDAGDSYVALQLQARPLPPPAPAAQHSGLPSPGHWAQVSPPPPAAPLSTPATAIRKASFCAALRAASPDKPAPAGCGPDRRMTSSPRRLRAESDGYPGRRTTSPVGGRPASAGGLLVSYAIGNALQAAVPAPKHVPGGGAPGYGSPPVTAGSMGAAAGRYAKRSHSPRRRGMSSNDLCILEMAAARDASRWVGLPLRSLPRPLVTRPNPTRVQAAAVMSGRNSWLNARGTLRAAGSKSQLVNNPFRSLANAAARRTPHSLHSCFSSLGPDKACVALHCAQVQ